MCTGVSTLIWRIAMFLYPSVAENKFKARTTAKKFPNTVEPRFNEVAGDRPNVFVKWRVRYIEVLFHTFYCNFGRDIEIISFVISRTSLNRGSLNRGSTVCRLANTSIACVAGVQREGRGEVECEREAR